VFNLYEISLAECRAFIAKKLIGRINATEAWRLSQLSQLSQRPNSHPKLWRLPGKKIEALPGFAQMQGLYQNMKNNAKMGKK